MTKFPFCEDCPLIDQPIVYDDGPTNSPIVFVGEAPGTTEVRDGKPFVGMSGKLLNAVLEELGIDRENILVTNTCLCKAPRNEVPDGAVKCCNQRLLETVINKDMVVLLGATAITAVDDFGCKSIKSVRGSVRWSEKIHSWVIPTYHPAAIIRQPDLFTDFLNDIRLSTKTPEPVDSRLLTFQVIRTLNQLIRMRDDVVHTKPSYVALDIETTGLDEMTDRVLCIGIATGERVYVIDAKLLYESMDSPHLVLRDLLTAHGLVWVGQNANQFDRKFLKYHFFIDWQVDFDTMLAHYCLDERQRTHDLKQLARRYFNAPDYAIDHKKSVTENELFLYCAIDVDYTHKLAWELAGEVNDEGMRDILDDILLPAAECLSDIEHLGVLLDTDYLQELEGSLSEEVARLTEEVREELGRPDFNPNSPQQVGKELYEHLKLRGPGLSTTKKELAELKHPIADKILSIRQKQKLLSTYVRGLLERVGGDGRIRGSFLLHGTVTGRLSSRDPNLQNIPQGSEIRSAFVATPGWTLIEADYNQLELRVAAYFSKDRTLCQTFANEDDIHTRVACDIFGVRPEEVTKEQRRSAKFVDFGVIYGRGAKALAEGELQCSVSKAQKWLNNFLAQYPQLNQWILRQKRQAVEKGYVESAFGRKRRFPLVLSMTKNEIERQASNAPIQSTASDICLMALIRLHKRFDPNLMRILLTVHDSILVEVKWGCEDVALEILHQEMVEGTTLVAPFAWSIETKQGERWGELS